MSKHIENSSVFAQSTGMNMTMIEKVARAICKSRCREDWECFLYDARAAIEAMREPTDEMLNSDLWNAHGYSYEAMIDAALKEK